MVIDLDLIVRDVRTYAGLLRKNPIEKVVDTLRVTQEYGRQLPNYGDDAAVIPWKDGYLLFAADGMMTELLINEPFAAGKASVMVTVNDIYAMGGRPLGMVNVLASGLEEQRLQIVKGIAKGCQKLRVPMLGGHLHPDAPDQNPSLSVSILGSSQKLLRSHRAQAGDKLLVAVDLEGRAGCSSVTSWDANSGKSSEQLLARLEVLPQLAEQELVFACKDISNAGLLGTLAIMMENSGKGAVIDCSSVPKPESITLRDWLLCFQSYGFVLAVAPQCTEKVISMFAKQGITARIIGEVLEEPSIRVQQDEKVQVLFDFEKESITGISV